MRIACTLYNIACAADVSDIVIWRITIVMAFFTRMFTNTHILVHVEVWVLTVSVKIMLSVYDCILRPTKLYVVCSTLVVHLLFHSMATMSRECHNMLGCHENKTAYVSITATLHHAHNQAHESKERLRIISLSDKNAMYHYIHILMILMIICGCVPWTLCCMFFFIHCKYIIVASLILGYINRIFHGA